jgi:glutamyl-tRNA reductase
MKDFCVLGLNHKTAPVALRERFVVDDVPAALAELRAWAGEAALLSTCNRFEVYAHGVADPAPIVAWLAARAGTQVDELRAHAYLRSGRNACKHLFFVASALDSLVVGETQIRSQVRDAYRRATDAGTVGPMLHALFQSALRVSKEIADRTGVGRGTVSVAGAAADLAERVFGPLADASVLVLGAGETAQLVLTHLAGRGVQRVRVLNRTPEHAAELAGRFGGASGGLDDLDDALADADVLVAAAAGEQPMVALDAARRALRRRRGRPVVALDLSVPRAIDPRVDALDNWYRYDMDALEAVTRDGLRHRRSEFLQCCTLVDAATLRLAEEARSREVGAIIAEVETVYLTIADEELGALERRLPEMQEEERAMVRRAVHRIVRKLLHMPVRALRHGGSAESDAIRNAFAAPSREDEP